MSDNQLLALAEAYYMVARDLEYHSQYMGDAAKFLAGRGDAICEQNIRDESPKPEPVTPSPTDAAP